MTRETPEVEHIGAQSTADSPDAAQLTITCVACGYDLRGHLATGGSGGCPECDMPIARSIAGDSLVFADTRWLLTIARGMSLIVWAFVIAIFTSLAVTLAVPFVVRAFAASISPRDLLVIGGLLLIGIMLVSAIGAWMVTVREPRTMEQAEAITARRIVRWCVMGIITILVLIGLLRWLPAMQWTTAASVFILVALLAVAVISLLLHIAPLWSRLPPSDVDVEGEKSVNANKPAKQTNPFTNMARLLMWALPLFAVLMVAMIVGGPWAVGAARHEMVPLFLVSVVAPLAALNLWLLTRFATTIQHVKTLNRRIRAIVRDQPPK